MNGNPQDRNTNRATSKAYGVISRKASGSHATKSSARSAGVLSSRPSSRRHAATRGGTPKLGKGGGSRRGGSRGTRDQSASTTIVERIASSKAAIVIIAVVALLAIVLLFDMSSNAGKAFGNVSINGIDVGGKTEDEIKVLLHQTYDPSVMRTEVSIFANEKAANGDVDELVQMENEATAEQLSTEEAEQVVNLWQVNAESLGATVPYDRVTKQALALGRSDGGFLKRLELLVVKHDLDLGVEFDENALETIASSIDSSIGEERSDTTVGIEEGQARVVEGHAGKLVDREWLTSKLSDALMSADEGDNSFIAEVKQAESRITDEQAREAADAVNRAISDGASFTFQGNQWNASPSDLGAWTNVEVAKSDDGYKLDVSLDENKAIPAVMKGAGAVMTAEDVVITFENAGDDILVHTSGSGNVPEVKSAVAELANAMYGEQGKAWGSNGPIAIEIVESERPETLTFDEALDLGIITEIGTYTTEFSALEGTENRNHNIKLAADIMDRGIVQANGGLWDFNERSGPTDKEHGFKDAGSIVGGTYVDSEGGGICQVATTVFNAAFEAGVPIVERHNHSLYIASYPTGRDAAVDYPGTTLVWRNDFTSDILLRMSYGEDYITATLYSVYTGYSVETETGEWEEGAEYGTSYEVDPDLAEGQAYRKTVGANGSSVSITRTVKDEDGKVVDEEIFESVYKPKNEVYAIGAGTDVSDL